MTEQDAHLIREHSQRFTNIENRLERIEARMNQIITLANRLDEDIYNHGQDGLKTQFVKFMIDHQATERAHKDHQRKSTVLMRWILGLIIALICAIIAHWK